MRHKILVLAALGILAGLAGGYALARADKCGQAGDANTAVQEHYRHGWRPVQPVAVGKSAYVLVKGEDGNYYVISIMRATAKKVKGISGKRD